MRRRMKATKAIGHILDECEEWEIDVTSGPGWSYTHHHKMICVPDSTHISNTSERAEDMLFSLAHEYGHARLFFDNVITEWITEFCNHPYRRTLEVHEYLKTFDERAAWWVGGGYIPTNLRGGYWVYATECLQSYMKAGCWESCCRLVADVNIGDWKKMIRGNPPYPRT